LFYQKNNIKLIFINKNGEQIMKSVNRRGFLKKSAVATAGLIVAAPAVKKGWAKNSPNETINIAVTGIRSRGGAHISSFSRIPNVTVAAICDIDENLFPESVARIEKLTGKKPKTYVDFRDLLDDKDIDAVSIATPDHWHALQTIWACQAGKDVYVEKPVSYTVDEGRKAVQAARKYNRIVQAGMQNRSSPSVRAAMRFLHDGNLGEIYMAKGVCYKPRASIGHKKDSPIPKGVNWDLFLGPAPYRPFNENRFHYNWHWFWDTGTTDMGNQGIHEMDKARWGLNKRVHPVRIHGTGHYYVWDSDQETPNTQVASFKYKDGNILQFEVRGLYTNDEDGIRIGNLFFGTEGWMHLDVDTKWRTYYGRKNEPGPSSETVEEDTDPMNLAGAGGGNHFENFINAVRSGKREDLTCEIEEGHMSTVLPHLANIAYRCGRMLTFDGAEERFEDDRKANALLTRDYRKPFVVPKHV